MTFNFSSAQVIAFLFATGGVVSVFVEDSPSPHGFWIENSESGAAGLMERLIPLRDMTREPLLCIGAAPGASVEGVLAKELLSAPVRRFLVAQGKYEIFAKQEDFNPDDAQTLLRACRDLFLKSAVEE